MDSRKFLSLFVAGVLGVALAAGAKPAQAESTILAYSVDVASNYVFRGIDVFQGVQDAKLEDRSAFNVAPAVQPSFTFSGPPGFTVNLWGSFALMERELDGADLGALDELDITLNFGWENKLGSFNTGYVVYNGVNPRGTNFDEIFFKWGLPFMKALSPEFAHYADPDSANQYTSLAVSGGDSITWGLSLGIAKTDADNGPQDLTGKVGYGFGSSSVSFNFAYRPDMGLQGYDANGQYDLGDGVLRDGPQTIFWVTYSYGGEVKE